MRCRARAQGGVAASGGGARTIDRPAAGRDAHVVAAHGSQRVLHGLVGEVWGLLRRNWFLALPPAAVLGAGADVLVLVRAHLGAEIVVGLVLALAFELYVGYAELIVHADRSGGPRPRTLALMRRALPLTPALLVASVIAVSVPIAATGLLVIPGLWLMTIWSLFAPAIVHEHLGAMASLKRSAALVRGAFWAVALSVTASILVEHAALHATAHEAEPASGSLATALIVAAVVTAAVSAPAAFTISVVYERLNTGVQTRPAVGSVHPRSEEPVRSRSA
jgi:hypothetical protein